jgi:hypothetical protein
MRWWSWGLPGVGQEAEVVSVDKRHSYLDTTLDVEGEKYRFFFPAGYTCTQVIKPGAKVDYVAVRPGPAVRNVDGRCDPVGVLSLAEWVQRFPRQLTPAEPVRDITFDVFYTDKDVALARGEFHFKGYRLVQQLQPAPRARTTAIKKEIRVIAVIPNTRVCRTPIKEGKATAEFHPDSEHPFQLRSGKDVCPILGLVRTIEVPRPIGSGKRVD